MTVSGDEIKQFLATHKGRGAVVLSVLAKRKAFFEAVSDPIGSKLMEGMIVRMEVLLEKTISGESSEEDRVELKVLRRISGEWADNVSAYLKECEKVRTNKL